MVDLAQHMLDGPVSLKSIASRHSLSENYLEQLVPSLRQAGMIKSVRGSQGGYVLTKEPDQIPVGEIIRAVEGPIISVECEYQSTMAACLCDPEEQCLTRDLWVKIRDSVNDLVDSIMLADLVKQATIES